MSTLTEQEWKRVQPLLKNIDVRRQEAAYNRLVKGETLVKAGEPYGYSRQDVNLIVKAVMKWYEKLNSMPDKPQPPKGWVTVEFFVPRNHVVDVRRVVEAMYPQPKPESEPAGKEKGPARSRERSSKPETRAPSARTSTPQGPRQRVPRQPRR